MQWAAVRIHWSLIIAPVHPAFVTPLNIFLKFVKLNMTLYHFEIIMKKLFYLTYRQSI